MKDYIFIKIKNKKALLLGGISGFISIFFLSEIFQSVIAFLFFSKPISLRFEGITFCSFFELDANLSSLLYVVTFLSPLFIVILFIELSNLLMKKTGMGIYRYSSIIFQMICFGYLLLKTFYGGFSLLVERSVNNDFVNLANYLEMTQGGRIVFVFLIIIIITAYLNLSSKRIIQYINY